MGNQCTSRCRSSSQHNNDHRATKDFQQTNLAQAIFKQQRAITDVHNIAYPLSTNSNRIVDGFDRRIKLSFITVKGCESGRFCLDGLEDWKLEQLCEKIRQLNFNGVKVLYSVELVIRNPIVKERFLGENEDLYHKNALNVLDLVINRITKTGMMVVLSNYSSSSKTSLSTQDGEGLWWTDKYSEFQWLDAHKHMVKRYEHNPRVIGFQLRTHIRGTSKTIPTWGDGSILTDWRRAAQICANEIQAINRNCLIFVGGLNYGCDLKSVQSHILTEVTNLKKIVYTGSFLTQHWNVLSWRMHKYQYFAKQMQDLLTCIRKRGHPVWISEFLYEFDIPWDFIIKYLEQTDLDWCFSSFNTLLKSNKKNDEYSSDRITNILLNLRSIQQSTSGSSQEHNQYATATLPANMISSNQVEIIRYQNGYNVDELLDSTPAASLDQIRQEFILDASLTGKEQICMDQNGMISKPVEVRKQYDE